MGTDNPYQELVDALLPWHIEVPWPGGDPKWWLLDPPTTRQALLLFSLLKDQPIPSQQRRLDKVLAEWWPDDLLEAMPDWEDRTPLLLKLLTPPDVERQEKDYVADGRDKSGWLRSPDFL